MEPLKRGFLVVVIVRLGIGFPSVFRCSFKRGRMFAEVAADGDNVQFCLFARVFFVLFEVFKQGFKALITELVPAVMRAEGVNEVGGVHGLFHGIRVVMRGGLPPDALALLAEKGRRWESHFAQLR